MQPQDTTTVQTPHAQAKVGEVITEIPPQDLDLEGLPVLSPKRQKFLFEYLKDRNATQAAIRAGYSPISARVQGHRLLTNDNIQRSLMAYGELGLSVLADVAANGKGEMARVVAASKLVDMGVEKPKEEGEQHGDTVFNIVNYNAPAQPSTPDDRAYIPSVQV